MFLAQHTRDLLKLEYAAQLPLVESVERGVVCIIDISGFTALTNDLQAKYGSDGGARLKEVINRPLTKIIELVHDRGGSVVKFAGDAAIVCWTIPSGQSQQEQDVTLVQPFLCACELLHAFRHDRKLQMLRPETPTSSLHTEHLLHVHIGIGYGQMHHVYFGENEHPQDNLDGSSSNVIRREYVLAGKSVSEAGTCLNVGTSGQIIFTGVYDAAVKDAFARVTGSSLKLEMKQIKEQLTLVEDDQDFAEFIDVFPQPLECREKFLEEPPIAFAAVQPYIDESLAKACRQLVESQNRESRANPSVSLQKSYMEARMVDVNTSTNNERSLLMSVTDDLNKAASNSLQKQSFIQIEPSKADVSEIPIPTSTETPATSPRFLESYNQIRKVSIAFLRFPSINIITLAEPAVLQQAQMIMLSILLCMRRFQGVLRQMNCDDKAFTALLVWGAEGFSHERYESRYAIRACLEMSDKFRDIVGEEFYIGVTVGKVYMGIIGTEQRSDGTVLGACVNNAARLMCLEESRNHILCDETTYMEGLDYFDFRADYEPVKLKGSVAKVKIFSALGARTSNALSVGHNQGFLVGRETEIAWIDTAIQEWRSGIMAPKIFLTGPLGFGKSAIYEHFHQTFITVPSNLICLTLGDEMYQTVPLYSLGMFSKMFFQKLGQAILDDRLGESTKLLLMKAAHLEGKGSQSLAHRRHLDFSIYNDRSIMAVLEMLLDSVDEPHSSIEVFKLIPGVIGLPSSLDTKNSMSLIAPLFVKIILKCRDLGLQFIFGFDDVQWFDEESGKVYAEIIRKNCGTLHFFMARPVQEWGRSKYLYKQIMNLEDLVHLDLEPLSRDHIKRLMLNRLGAEVVENEIVTEVYEKCQGVPLAANIMIDSIKSDKGIVNISKAVRRVRRKLESARSDPNQIAIAAQLDSLKRPMKYLLTLASIAGQTFSLQTLIKVMDILDAREVPERNLGKLITMITNENRFGMLKETSTEGVYDFSSYLVHQAVQSTLLPTKRRQFHMAFAAYYERSLSVENQDKFLPFLIQHLLALEDQKELQIKYLRMGFLLCVEKRRWQDALNYRKQLIVCNYKEEPSSSLLSKIQERRLLALLHNGIGNKDTAVECCREALRLCGLDVPGPDKTAFQIATAFFPTLLLCTKLHKMSESRRQTKCFEHAYKMYRPVFQTQDSTKQSTTAKNPRYILTTEIVSTLDEIAQCLDLLGQIAFIINRPLIIATTLLTLPLLYLIDKCQDLRLSWGYNNMAIISALCGLKGHSDMYAAESEKHFACVISTSTDQERHYLSLIKISKLIRTGLYEMDKQRVTEGIEFVLGMEEHGLGDDAYCHLGRIHVFSTYQEYGSFNMTNNDEKKYPPGDFVDIMKIYASEHVDSIMVAEMQLFVGYYHFVIGEMDKAIMSFKDSHNTLQDKLEQFGLEKIRLVSVFCNCICICTAAYLNATGDSKPEWEKYAVNFIAGFGELIANGPHLNGQTFLISLPTVLNIIIVWGLRAVEDGLSKRQRSHPYKELSTFLSIVARFGKTSKPKGYKRLYVEALANVADLLWSKMQTSPILALEGFIMSAGKILSSPGNVLKRTTPYNKLVLKARLWHAKQILAKSKPSGRVGTNTNKALLERESLLGSFQKKYTAAWEESLLLRILD